MHEEKEFILSKDGKKLLVHSWQTGTEGPILAIVHGLGEHGGRYAPLAEVMVNAGVNVFVLDLRGHGQSEGERGHTPSYSLLQSDIEEFLKYCRAEHNESRLFLMGHSMGGNLVAHYVKHDTSQELSGFILSSPFFEVAFEPPAWKVQLAHAVGSILPGLTQGNELDPTAISRDASEVEKYVKDPLVHDRISVRLYLSIIAAGQKLLDDGKSVKIPGLVYHGDADRLVSYTATERFAKRNPNLTWVPLPGYFHEPHNDEGREKVYEMIREFVLSN